MSAELLTHPTRILKARDTIVRIGQVTNPNRPYAIYSGTSLTVLSGIGNAPATMTTLNGVTTANFQISDDEQTYRLLGGSGWTDSVIVNSRAQASITTYFLKDLEFSGTGNNAVFSAGAAGAFDEAQEIIASARNNKDIELWVEIYKLLDFSGGNYFYDVACFAACIMNYQESYPADNLTELTFDLMSRGEVSIGKLTSANQFFTGLPNP